MSAPTDLDRAKARLEAKAAQDERSRARAGIAEQPPASVIWFAPPGTPMPTAPRDQVPAMTTAEIERFWAYLRGASPHDTFPPTSST